jgi:16S rRNA (guanine966-N2)-methyltransferase
MKPRQQGNQLRIIGGRWRGRKLAFAAVPGLRPTPDRVRETLFNWLGPLLQDARCLDLFAGSGALGIEAASRGAAEVVMVDNHPLVVRTLCEQLQLLGFSAAQVVQQDVNQWLATTATATPFDVVFLDPPFREERLPDCIALLEAGGWLAAAARIYMEAEKSWTPVLPDSWELYRSKQAGQVGYHLAVRA